MSSTPSVAPPLPLCRPAAPGAGNQRSIAVLRITRTEGVPTIVRVEGRIAGAYVDELRRVVEPEVSRSAPVALVLSDVTFVDHRGAELLRALRAQGAELVDCSTYVLSAVNGGAV